MNRCGKSGNMRVFLFSKVYRLHDFSFIVRDMINFYRLFKEVGVTFEYERQLSSFKEVKEILSGSKNVAFLVVDIFDCLILLIYSIFLVKKTSVIYRVQGTVADESFIKHRSHLKRVALLVLEGIAVEFSEKLIVVSEEHKKVLIKRYGKNLANKTFVLPNLLWKDEILHKSPYMDNRKHISFCYVGSASKWQNIGVIHDILGYLTESLKEDGYSISIKFISPRKDHILINELFYDVLDKAKFVLIDVPPTKVSSEIQNYDFGFLIRDCSIVNRVSSPLKLPDYLRAGVRVVVSGKIGVLSQFPVLERYGIICHLDFDKLIQKNINEYKKVKNWILDVLHVPFSEEIVRESFTFDKFIESFRAFLLQ